MIHLILSQRFQVSSRGPQPYGVVSCRGVAVLYMLHSKSRNLSLTFSFPLVRYIFCFGGPMYCSTRDLTPDPSVQSSAVRSRGHFHYRSASLCACPVLFGLKSPVSSAEHSQVTALALRGGDSVIFGADCSALRPFVEREDEVVGGWNLGNACP